MTATSSSHGRRRAPVAAALLLATLTLGVAGCGAPATATPSVPSQVSAGTSSSAPASPSGTTPGTATSGTPAASAAPSAAPITQPPPAPVKGPVLPASAPVSLSVPDIGLTTPLLALGRDAKGEADVPPGEAGSPAGWYKYSPTPGERGPSVILGHVNTTTIAEGVFYRLHELKPGEQFSVARADGSTLVFVVDRNEVFQKASFPTLAVYGNTDRAEIRLITCGGYEPSTGEFVENTVVYGHLLSSTK